MKRILLADDSITIQKVVELTFSDGDYEIVAANNGSKAIQKLAEWRPDIILSDIIMPEKNGYEVCEYVKSHPEYRDIPVILLTGTFEPFDPDRAEKAGCDAVVTKPFESQSLIHKVEELIAQRRSAPSTPQRTAEMFLPARDVTTDDLPPPSMVEGGAIAGQTLPWRMPDFAPPSEHEVFQQSPQSEEPAPFNQVPFNQTAPWQETPDESAYESASTSPVPAEETDPFAEPEPESESDHSLPLSSAENVFEAEPSGQPDDSPFNDIPQATPSPSWELATPSAGPLSEYGGGETQAFPMIDPDDPLRNEGEAPVSASPGLEMDRGWESDEAASDPDPAEDEPMGRTLPFPRIQEPDVEPEADLSPALEQKPDSDSDSGETSSFSDSSDTVAEPFASSGVWSSADEEFATTENSRDLSTVNEPQSDREPSTFDASPFSQQDSEYADNRLVDDPVMDGTEDRENGSAEITDDASIWSPPLDVGRAPETREAEDVWSSTEGSADPSQTAEVAEEDAGTAAFTDSDDVSEDDDGMQTEAAEPAASAAYLEEQTYDGASPVDGARSQGSTDGHLLESDIERIARRVVELMSEQTVKNIAWEVIPDMAEMVVRERIRELENQN